MTSNAFGDQKSDEPDPFASADEASVSRLFGGVVAMVVGGLLLLGGIILHFGEKADRLFIFPFAGRLTILLGIAVLGVGAAFAGRRAALILSGLMVIGGIVVYVIGLIFVEQIGSRVYQAIGLLTVLVGLISVYSCYGMDVGAKPSGPNQSDRGP
jgi:hypothetical protein